MRLFPVDRVALYTPLPKSEALERLGYNTSDNGGKRFRGAIAGDSFAIRRAITYRNSFLPQIKGAITETAAGTTITITLRLTKAIQTFMVIWLSVAALALIGILAASVFDGFSALAALIPLAMLGFGIAMVNIGFSSESERAVDELRAILEARVK